jgi:hypothetical protein
MHVKNAMLRPVSVMCLESFHSNVLKSLNFRGITFVRNSMPCPPTEVNTPNILFFRPDLSWYKLRSVQPLAIFAL